MDRHKCKGQMFFLFFGGGGVMLAGKVAENSNGGLGRGWVDRKPHSTRWSSAYIAGSVQDCTM